MGSPGRRPGCSRASLNLSVSQDLPPSRSRARLEFPPWGLCAWQLPVPGHLGLSPHPPVSPRRGCASLAPHRDLGSPWCPFLTDLRCRSPPRRVLRVSRSRRGRRWPPRLKGKHEGTVLAFLLNGPRTQPGAGYLLSPSLGESVYHVSLSLFLTPGPISRSRTKIHDRRKHLTAAPAVPKQQLYRERRSISH